MDGKISESMIEGSNEYSFCQGQVLSLLVRKGLHHCISSCALDISCAYVQKYSSSVLS